MNDFEHELLKLQASIESMSAEEKKALALRLCGIVNETAFDMVAAHRQGAAPERVMEVAADTMERRFHDPYYELGLKLS